MARNLFGGTAGDVAETADGARVPGAVGTVWDGPSDGANQITDLQNSDGTPITQLVADYRGFLGAFLGPDNGAERVWLDFGNGRVSITSTTVGERFEGHVSAIDPHGSVAAVNSRIGQSNGIAALDGNGLVPVAQLPADSRYASANDKGAAGGLATLDTSGRLPSTQVAAALQIGRATPVRRFDTTAATAAKFYRKPLFNSPVCQAMTIDYKAGFVYTAQLMQGGLQLPGEPAAVDGTTRSNNGDICITKLTMTGSIVGSMYVKGAGHGATMSVEYGKDGLTYLWIDRDSSGSGFARSLSRIQFADGTVLDSRSTTKYAPLTSTMHGVCASVDNTHRLIAVRWTWPDPDVGGRRLALYDLDQALAGVWNPLAVYDTPTTPTFQGIVTWGGYCYILEGDPLSVAPAGNAYVSTLEWATTTVVQRTQLTGNAELTYREPEGMAISLPDQQNPHSAQLFFGWADGASGSRDYTLNYFRAPASSTVDRVTVMDSATAPSAADSGGGVLYSTSGQPFWRDPSGQTWALGTTPQNPNVNSADHGFLSWSYDPAPSQGTSAPTAGTLYMSKQVIRASASISKIWYAVATAGAGLTAGQCTVNLYSATGTLLASVDQTTAMGSTGVKSASLSTPYSASPGVYYVGILVNGTTAPVLARGSGTVSGLANAGLSPANYRFGTSGTNQTAPPATVTMASLGNAITGTFWTALS